jgi:uncharacterized protein YukE
MGDTPYTTPRTDVQVSVPVPIPGTGVPIYITGGVSQDNVYATHTPDGLTTRPGEAGAKTEWDATTLDAAVTWLTAHADYLDRMYRGMAEIRTLMDGPDVDQTTRSDSGTMNRATSTTPQANGGPLGGFKGSSAIAAKHDSLYQGFNTGLKNIVENLYDAADALTKIKAKYTNAEQVNALGAADVESIFGELGQSQHNV